MIRLCLTLVALVVSLPARAEIRIQNMTTPGGINAWLVEEHNIPFVALELRWQGGASLDPAGKRGATYMMVGLLEEGSGTMDAQGFAQAREALAAEFEYDIGDDAIAVSARFLTENRDAAMALLRSSLVEPSFDAASVERVRTQILSGIRSDLKDPNEIARAKFDRLVYGDHPYGSAYQGTEASVAALTQDDLRAVHKGTMTRDRLFVSAVGDITAAELATLLDGLLGDMPATGFDMPPLAQPQFPGGTVVVPFDTPQSVALWGQHGIAFEDPDFFAAYLLDVILGGGGFESRLMNEVREKRGLTYGVSSFLVDKDLAQVYMGQVASANDRIAQAVDVIRAEWARAAAEGVTED
jgi:zinc protease